MNLKIPALGLLLLKAPANDCSYCGCDIRSEWDEHYYPLQLGGEDVCEECWKEHSQFTCSKCEEYGMLEDMHKFLMVVDAEDADFPVGISAVTRKPYFVDYMIGGYLLPRSLSFIQGLPRHFETYGYACGHLCFACQEQLGLVTRTAA